MKTSRIAITATSAALFAATALFGAPLVGAESTDLGERAELTAGGVVQGWTISDLKQSTDVVSYPVRGTLWEATATNEAIQGNVQPVVSNLNARTEAGDTYRVLFQVASPQGISPAGLAQGQKSTGKVYFDVTGAAPDSVVYNDGNADLLTWVQPASPGATGAGSSAASTPAAPAVPAAPAETTPAETVPGDEPAAATDAAPAAPAGAPRPPAVRARHCRRAPRPPMRRKPRSPMCRRLPPRPRRRKPPPRVFRTGPPPNLPPAARAPRCRHSSRAQPPTTPCRARRTVRQSLPPSSAPAARPQECEDHHSNSCSRLREPGSERISLSSRLASSVQPTVVASLLAAHSTMPLTTSGVALRRHGPGD